MAQQRLPMRKIRDVLRLSAAGLSKRPIAASLGIGPTAAGSPMRGAAFDSWRSLRAAHGLHLLLDPNLEY